MKVTIDVTQDDIAHGKPEDGCYCPIALAARRVLVALPNLFVDSETLYLTGQPDPAANPYAQPHVSLPEAAQDFVLDFDGRCNCGDAYCDLRHECPGPFRFDLDVPDDLMAGAA